MLYMGLQTGLGEPPKRRTLLDRFHIPPSTTTRFHREAGKSRMDFWSQVRFEASNRRPHYVTQRTRGGAGGASERVKTANIFTQHPQIL